MVLHAPGICFLDISAVSSSLPPAEQEASCRSPVLFTIDISYRISAVVLIGQGLQFRSWAVSQNAFDLSKRSRARVVGGSYTCWTLVRLTSGMNIWTWTMAEVWIRQLYLWLWKKAHSRTIRTCPLSHSRSQQIFWGKIRGEFQILAAYSSHTQPA